MTELLLLLLPVAAATGWYAARRSGAKSDTATSPDAVRSRYFQGINYLLNEQPDKAIEVFIKVLEVDSETVETHLALGNLYRRRGEVDRAIRIHQNLIARPAITAQQRSEALLELGQDYMSAGLLDRAENLFQEMVDADTYKVQALRQLIDIYEQEKDWPKAIACGGKLELATGNQLGGVMAHYYCEEAKRLKQAGDPEKAKAMVGEALNAHKGCVRASLLEGDIHFEGGDFQRAVAAFRRIEDQDPDFLSEAVERIRACYEKLGDATGVEQYLTDILDRYGGVTVTLALAELKQQQAGDAAAVAFIAEQLRKRPNLRGFHHLVDLMLGDSSGEQRDDLVILRKLTTKLLDGRPVYKCHHCGFPGKLRHWQCPGCKHWNTIKPIYGVEGE